MQSTLHNANAQALVVPNFPMGTCICDKRNAIAHEEKLNENECSHSQRAGLIYGKKWCRIKIYILNESKKK